MLYDCILKDGRIIDPNSGTDVVSDVAISEGKIAHIGKLEDLSAACEVVDVSGLIVAPGLIDIHLHAYGALGVLDPDTLGVLSGVTTMVDAGSCGAYNYTEMETLLDDSCKTDWFTFLHMFPLGVTGGTGEHQFVKSLAGIPLARMLDWVGKEGRVRGLKIGAFGAIGLEPIKLAKAVARILQIPLYVHIGDFLVRPPQITTPEVLNLLDAGDMVTHVYTGVYGGPFTEGGLAVEELRAAQQRGVVLDVGFGGFNCNFDMVRRGFEQGIFADVISSDLQNRNVTGPAKSLCHVMSAFLNLGMPLADVIERVTVKAAKAIYGEWWRGRIVVGGQADISLLKLEDGEYRFRDCDGQEISGTKRFVPVKVWKAGKGIDCRPELVEDFENWMVEKNEDGPAPIHLDSEDKSFLHLLNRRLQRVPWQLEKIHEILHWSIEESEIELRRAIRLVQAVCLKKPFPQSMAVLLKDLGRERTEKYIAFLLAA